MHVEALILAEGGSLLLRPLTDYLPTCLVPVGGTPILDHQIQALRSVGVSNITVLGGYRAAQVEQSCRAYDVVRFHLNPRYSREEPLLSSLRAAGPLVGGVLLLVRGDLLFDVSLAEELLREPRGNRAVVDGVGKPIGVWSLSPRAAEALFAASGAVRGTEETEPLLEAGVEAVLEGLGYESLPAEDHLWARVSTMEDLARALTVHRRAREAKVARSRRKLQQFQAREGAVSPRGVVPGTLSGPSGPRPWPGAGSAAPADRPGSRPRPARP